MSNAVWHMIPRYPSHTVQVHVHQLSLGVIAFLCLASMTDGSCTV